MGCLSVLARTFSTKRSRRRSRRHSRRRPAPKDATSTTKTRITSNQNDIPRSTRESAPIISRKLPKSLPTLPLPPSQFISYFAENPEVPIRQLLEPYLTYETWLRLEFAKNPSQADGFENLVSIYDGQEDKLKIRAIDRQTADRNKYILPLSKREREKDGSLAITSSLLDYRDNFKGFTRSESSNPGPIHPTYTPTKRCA